jgi:hypothetical protein
MARFSRIAVSLRCVLEQIARSIGSNGVVKPRAISDALESTGFDFFDFAPGLHPLQVQERASVFDLVGED